jgi:DNA polymerase-3 subunit alpha
VDIDSESDKRAVVFKTVQDYFRNIGGDVVNVCTFGTEGTKSALKTSARGLNIDDDLVSYMTSMIPNERGFDWSLSDCYHGSEKDDRAPIKEFVRVMDENPLWWQLAQSIEGLVTRLGVHASGVICVNGDFINHGSYMKTNKGQIVTALDLHDQEKCGVLKYDMLTVSALDRIHQTLNYMLEDGTIEWQGSLKATYDKYLHPSVLDYDSEEMWRMASDGEIRSLFQLT